MFHQDSDKLAEVPLRHKERSKIQPVLSSNIAPDAAVTWGPADGRAMVDLTPPAALPGRWQQREQSASAPCTTKAQQAKAISVRQWKFDAKKPSRRAQAGLADSRWVYVSFPDIAIHRTCRFQSRRHDDPGELHTGELRTTSRHA